ncbi:DUF3383 domain-containing protein [Rouxiella sp. WC2420]|uniref:DUF3383 domain-containing protein n=1 Tax=Rouxiella sp. WC2420 TaxID=3234145 RepID=A0AB39VM30_9GAMM
MAIPLSKDVQILPSVLAAAGSAVDLNGLILTDSAYAAVGSLLSFSSTSDVTDYFGSQSNEGAMATVYFQGYNNCTKTPGTLYLSQFNSEAVSAWLRSGSMASVTLDALKLFSGTLVLTVDGTLVTSTTITLSSATSYAAAAALIEAALGNEVTVVYDTTVKSFIITSATTGADSTITFASGTLADNLKLSSTQGAVISQGSDIANPTDTFKAILSASQDWAAFTTSFTATTAQHVAFSAWASAQSDRFAYAGWALESDATTTGSTDTFAYQVISTYDYGSVIPVYGDRTKAANVLGFAAALNFDATNGRRTLKYRALDGLSADVSDSDDYDALAANGYNFYGQYTSNNFNEKYWAPGSITGDFKWVDAFFGQVWFNAQLQQDVITLFMSDTYVPYNAAGRAQIEASMADTFAQFLAWGGMSTGTDLSASQILQIKNTVGSDISTSLIAKGYYLYIGPFTATMRSNRTTPSCTLYYCDGGAVQKLTLASVEVQ